MRSQSSDNTGAHELAPLGMPVDTSVNFNRINLNYNEKVSFPICRGSGMHRGYRKARNVCRPITLECGKPACAVCKDGGHKNVKKRSLQSDGVNHIAG
jgi:hypothetical protein